MTPGQNGGERDLDERPVPGLSGIHRLYLRMRHSGEPSRINGFESAAPAQDGPAKNSLRGSRGGGGRRQQSPAKAAVLPKVKPDLLERLSPAALETLSFAQEEATTLGHRSVGTEHLLLAITRDPESGAYKILEQLGAVPATVRAEVLHVLVTGPEVEPAALTLTPRARLALELAHRASTRIGVPQTGTEHLLIGLAAESEGIAARILSKSGISAKAAENQVTANLDGKNADESEARRG
jgi:hypothetical protein